MEFLDSAFAAANAGVDTLVLGVKPLLALYTAYLVTRLRTQLLSGVPVFLQGALASLIETVLAPLINNAVRAAEEHGNRLAKDAIARARLQIGTVKLVRAREYIRHWVPDWLFDDATVDTWIDAALVRLGIGATKGIKVGVEYLEGKLGEVPPPPTAAHKLPA